MPAANEFIVVFTRSCVVPVNYAPNTVDSINATISKAKRYSPLDMQAVEQKARAVQRA